MHRHPDSMIERSAGLNIVVKEMAASEDPNLDAPALLFVFLRSCFDRVRRYAAKIDVNVIIA